MPVSLPPIWDRTYPQNFFIRYPLWGSFAFSIYCYVFLLLYMPLGIHPNGHLTFGETMARYAVCIFPCHYLISWYLKRLPFFSNTATWTLKKEVILSMLNLVALGVCVYILGYLIEGPAGRLNFFTFFDSLRITLLLGCIPYLFAIATNLGTLSTPRLSPPDTYAKTISIHIVSRLKNESLTFQEDEFLYAESDGNYINFFLYRGEVVQSYMIRNAMSDVERLLLAHPALLRTHRAFIVNLNKVLSVTGNATGYRLKVAGVDVEIPVSRANIKKFDEQYTSLGL